jgi:hypothetical protein
VVASLTVSAAAGVAAPRSAAGVFGTCFGAY